MELQSGAFVSPVPAQVTLVAPQLSEARRFAARWSNSLITPILRLLVLDCCRALKMVKAVPDLLALNIF
jgi:hypothetical protein